MGDAAQEDRVARALGAVPRAPFLPPALRRQAGLDAPVPIGHGQTNSQPFTVATMLGLLDVHPGQRVLDVGAGSGWTTALLAHLVGAEGRVIGVERHEALIGPSRRALTDGGFGEVAEIRLARAGVLGVPQEAPFDRILVSAEARALPPSLVDQLADDGVMVIPVGSEMRRVERRGEDLIDTGHGAFRFVPLVED
ncbi:protein-L-isoaspartate O-methyltransferase [Brachybacterium sp. FME24]|uniref:protein-L-isoaspartate O-methyltransferase family protein n=1 Tax=Brachybacterium sp. FME24 TaxID=2742605 RepID=UPI00186914FE|nr:methyltransferase domain-containing protein [Brachybacterium sp. FME24]